MNVKLTKEQLKRAITCGKIKHDTYLGGFTIYVLLDDPLEVITLTYADKDCAKMVKNRIKKAIDDNASNGTYLSYLDDLILNEEKMWVCKP